MMTLQEKIRVHAGRLPESMQQEVWAFIQSIESRGRQPEETIESSSGSASPHLPSALDLAIVHGVVGCVENAPVDLSENQDHMREYGV